MDGMARNIRGAKPAKPRKREDRNVTISDIAQHAGVSRATVSLVLRESPKVKKDTRTRVLRSIEDLGYLYNRAAANLRAHTTKTIGVLVPNLANPFYANVAAGIDAELDKAGWVAFLANTNEDTARQDRFLQRMREQHVDGIILCHAAGTEEETVRRLESWHLPTVQTLRRIGKAPHDYASGDYTAGFRLAVDHLVALGHRQIGFIGSNRDHSAFFERADGYRLGMRAHNLEARDMWRCEPTRAGGMAAADEVRRRKRVPTAYLCHNDVVALGFMRGMAAAGIQAGRDIAIVGFDNIDEASFSSPALTTITVDPWKIGEDAARLMLRRLSHPEAPFETVLHAPSLVVRESCGAPRSKPRPDAGASGRRGGKS